MHDRDFAPDADALDSADLLSPDEADDEAEETLDEEDAPDLDEDDDDAEDVDFDADFDLDDEDASDDDDDDDDEDEDEDHSDDEDEDEAEWKADYLESLNDDWAA